MGNSEPMQQKDLNHDIILLYFNENKKKNIDLKKARNRFGNRLSLNAFI